MSTFLDILLWCPPQFLHEFKMCDRSKGPSLIFHFTGHKADCMQFPFYISLLVKIYIACTKHGNIWINDGLSFSILAQLWDNYGLLLIKLAWRVIKLKISSWNKVTQRQKESFCAFKHIQTHTHAFTYKHRKWQPHDEKKTFPLVQNTIYLQTI